jgi:DNA-binding Lrp family transcriptional regulator
MTESGQQDGSWTILTGHGHVLVEIARNPGARIRDISVAVGLTERSVQAIVADLEAAGYLTRTRVGRRTRYTVNPESAFRHSAQDGHRIGPFLDLLTAVSAEAGKAGGEAASAEASEADGAEAGTAGGAEARDTGNRSRWRPRKIRS